MANPDAAARDRALHRTNITDAAHWVIPELDARGQIDGHAAMCLRVTVADVVARTAAAIVIDLRDLTSIDKDAVALLTRAHGHCRARGVQLALLIGDRDPKDKLEHTLRHAGLNTQSHIARDRPVPPRPRRRPPRERLRLLPDLLPPRP